MQNSPRMKSSGWLVAALLLLILAAWLVWQVPARLPRDAGRSLKFSPTAAGATNTAALLPKFSANPQAARPALPATLSPGTHQLPTAQARGAGNPVRLVAKLIDTSKTSDDGALAADAANVYAGAKAGAWIVQFGGPVHEEQKAQILRAGAALCGYVPDNAFAVKMDGAALARVAALPFVQWIGPYKAGYKIQPSLAAKSSGTATIDVCTFTPDEADALAKSLAAAGAVKIEKSQSARFGRVRAEVPVAAVSNIATLDSVQWIEEHQPLKLFNNRAAEGPQLNVTNVWTTRGLTGTGQVIAVCDTGLDTGNLATLHTDFYGRVKAAIALGRTGNWSDTHGHGTHVCGSVLGDGGASGGKYRGMAHGAELIMQSVLDSGGGLGGIPSNLNDLLLPVFTNGARVHSDSWGSAAAGFYTSEARDVDEFIWDHPAMTVCIAAGNEGSDGNSDGVIDYGSMSSPASAKNSLTIGAAENFHNAGEASGYNWISFGYFAGSFSGDSVSRPFDGVNQGMAAFSSRGPCLDGRTKPDIVAPGTDVISTRSSVAGSGGWGNPPDFATKYMIDGGTSMATPLSAGCSALVRQYFTERAGTTNPSAALVKAALINGARSLSPGQYGTGSVREIPAPPRPNNVEGWGHLDIEGTLFPAAPRSLAFYDNDSLATGATNVYSVNLGGTNAFRATLCWSDFPATPGSSKNLINDLDLVVIGPDGVTNFSRNMSAPDRTNNVEGIDFASVTNGVWRIEVSGFNVPDGPQPYALVLSGPIAPVIAHTPLANTTNTVDAYAVDATITSAVALDTNQLFVMWNNDGSTNFTAAPLALVTNDLFRGLIPAQPLHTVVSYYIVAATNGLIALHPAGAPAVVHQFNVTTPVALTVTGTPLLVGSVWPPYGVTALASGNTINATAPAFAWTPDFNGYVCTGWTGSGSVPATGNSNAVSFQSLEASALTWHWRFDSFGLNQTSTPAGIVNTTTWWNANSTGQTITAPASASVTGTPHRLASWYIDGARVPAATGPTPNPAAGLLMSTSRMATALYLPTSQDSDTNALPDWWEMYYFGTTGNTATNDADSDGWSNGAELNDGTNPNDAVSVPRAPDIAHTPLANPQSRPAPWQVSATITDNFAVASASLYWQRNGGGWQSVAMTGGVANIFSAEIPAPGVGGDSFAYYIVAADPAGNVASNAQHSFYVTYPLMTVTPPNLGTNLVERGSTGIVSIVISNGGLGELTWSARVVRIDLDDNIEGGTNKWTHNGLYDYWHITTTRAHSATHSWYLGDESSHQYADQTDSKLVTPLLHPGSNAMLRFWQWISSEYDGGLYFWDGGVIELSTNNGASFFQIPPVGGYPYLITPNVDSPFPASNPCLAGFGGWEQISVDLGAWADRDIIIRFRFGADHYTVAEGWYLDDITITSDALPVDWLALAAQSGEVDPSSVSNIACLLKATIATNGGVYRSVIRIEGNDPVTPTGVVSVAMRVDTRPVASLNFAQQSPLDGSGRVTISNFIFDVDGDPLSVRAEFSADGGATWTNFFVKSASVTTGGVAFTNSGAWQISATASAPTNRLSIVWSSTNAPPVGYVTNVLVRVTPWDGWLAGGTVTSAPFAVDNIAPLATGAFASVSQSGFGNYVVGSVVTSSWFGFTDIGFGVSGYFLSRTNNSGTTNGTSAATSPAPLGGMQLNATNTIFIWARDAAGNCGPAASATVFVLDPDGDIDGDGFNNAAEELAGTSATNTASLLVLSNARSEKIDPNDTNDPPAMHLVIRWPFVTNRVYSLQLSSNVGAPPFLVITNPPLTLTNNTAIFDLTNAPPAGLLQFRLGVQTAP